MSISSAEVLLQPKVERRSHVQMALLLILMAASFGYLYWDVIVKLVHDWSVDDNYSYGYLIVPLAVYFAWQQRKEFLSKESSSAALGLLAVLASLCLLLAGVLGAEIFTTEVSMIGVLAGSLLFLQGWSRLKTLIFPLAFLLLMVPIPALIFNQIALPLQFIASGFAEHTLQVLHIPVLRDGNVIHLANMSLEVEEACSGIRSLMSLLALGLVYGRLMEPRTSIRAALALSTIPVAIVANGVRIAGTGVAAYYIGPEAAEGFLHMFAGSIVFLTAAVMLIVIHRLLCRLFAFKGDRQETGVAP